MSVALAAAYPGHGIISRQNEQLFEAWNKDDPVDNWERERARRIEQIQGNRHPFVTGNSRARTYQLRRAKRSCRS